MNKTRKNLQKIQNELNRAYKHIEIALDELSEIKGLPPALQEDMVHFDIGKLLELINWIDMVINDLRQKEYKEIISPKVIEGNLFYNAQNKRYRLLTSDLHEKDFHRGNHLQVLINDEWVDTRIEINAKGKWYLIGIGKSGSELEGLRVRVEGDEN